MLSRRFLIPSLLAMALAFALSGPGCIFSPDEDPDPPGDEPAAIPPPTTPTNLVRALEVIYDDKVRSATERRLAYENLLGPNFKFFLQPSDWDTCGCQDWGRDEEIQTHQNIFLKQENGEIYSLEVNLLFSPSDTVALNPPEPGRDDWREVFVSNVYLKLLTSPDNGWEVNGGQAQFKMQPLNNRWYIGEWADLPRP